MQDWFEFDKVEPIGGRRGDWQAASICSAVVNSSLRRPDVGLTTKDFLLTYGEMNREMLAQKPAAPVAPKPVSKPWQFLRMQAQIAAKTMRPDTRGRKRK